MNKLLLSFITLLAGLSISFAGNPDRQGEAGAYELLMNPWARSAGVNALNGASVKGVEALFVNPAGLSRITKTEVGFSHSRWLVPSGLSLNALGIAQRVGKSGVLGIGLTSLGFGDIRVTTTNNPEGTGATYSPNFFNIGIGYSHNFADKVTVAVLFRGISEAIQDVSAFGFGIDAGVQYVAGQDNQFKLGIALKNIGSPMRFSGEGLSKQLISEAGHVLTYDVRLSKFELPSLLNISLSYDFNFSNFLKLTPMANFTSNSFGRDEVGAGVELDFGKYFMLRGAYTYEIGDKTTALPGVYTGLSAGLTLSTPMKKKSDNMINFDYAYRATNPFQGTHNLGVRLSF
ncbi:MAG TPA: PorV/PorQ family protein [Saprospiraceae bacterium]|nr:PorV/PorQ family protein [Saprospiraceae bacterium]